MAFPTTPLLASVMTVALVLSSCGSEDTRSDSSTTAPTSSVAPLTTDPINTDPVAATEELFDQIDPEGPGCAVAVNQGGETQAWGSATLDPKAVLQPDTVFDMASITKQFTATAVLLLAEQGLIDLDASLSTYLPGLPGTRAGEGWTPVQSPWTQVGDGGLQTTPVDLALWGTQYWSPTVGGPDINAARIADAVATGGADDEVYGAGIGRAEIDGIGSVISHLGGWEAFISTFLVAPPQQVAVVASCNAVELQPVRESFGLELLRIWLPAP